MNIEALATAWELAKTAEQQANAERVKIEEQLIAALGQKEEGAVTHKVGDFKIEIVGKINRKLDFAAWDLVKDQFPENLRPIKVKEELDEKGVKYLQQNEPQLYAILPLEIKPAKTAVKVVKA
jgi:hypothetical protein